MKPCILFAALFWALALPIGADPAKTAPPTPTPKKLTLAQALAAAPPPADGLILTVSAELVTLPDSMAAPAADANTNDIAAAFGDQAISFGAVTAIAPQTMVLLNTQPDPPDFSSNIGTYTASKLLFASLDDAQWQALLSASGLGLADLTDDTQRGLFHALFPRGELWIGSADPALQDLPDEQRTDVQDVSGEIDATRIRLGQTANIYLHDTRGETIFYSTPKPDAAQRLETCHPKRPPSGKGYGVVLRAEVSNALKSSDLDWDKQVLQVSVPVTDLKTVGDLVTRIGQKTGIELYADPHYAARTAAVLGTAKAAPAADLLRALCVCVTGTFRKVGPAYVLTDDLVGVGVRRKHLAEWAKKADHVRDMQMDQAGAAMLKQRASDARKMPGFDDPLAVTPEEMAAVPDDPTEPGVPTILGHSFPFSKLTAAQKAWAQQAADSYNEKLQAGTLQYLEEDHLQEADVTHSVTLGVKYQLQMLVPSQSQPVEAGSSPLSLLFFDKTAAAVAADTKPPAPAAVMPPAPPLSAALRLGHVRAVRGHPRTAADVDALVAAMQTLGLNQLWLDVFSGGVNHVKTSAAQGTDILTEALARTRGTGISVYADLDLLAWGDAPPKAVQDLTIDGQNSREAMQAAAQSAQAQAVVLDAGKLSLLATLPVLVSPAAPTVQTTLTEAVGSFAARPGLAGFAWDRDNPNFDLGYTADMRLAFLRTAHADPVDVTDDADLQTNVFLQTNVALPLFDDTAVDADLAPRWTKARGDAEAALLNRLSAAAVSHDGKPLPVLAEQEEDSYVPWGGVLSNPRMPVNLSALSVSQMAQFMRANVVLRETVENDGDTAALARTLRDDAGSNPSTGFMLDFTHNEVTQGAAPLDALVQAVSAENTSKNSKTVEKTVK